MDRISHRRSRTALAALVAAGLLTAAIAGPTFAAKGGGSGTTGGKGGGKGGSGATGGSISAPVMVVDNNGSGTPNWGDFVTFNVSTTATTQPWVNLVCTQNGVVVAQGWDGYFDGSITSRNFGLYSSAWTSGAADCTAYLTTPTWVRLASTSFHVDP